jgi:hypothetical protein
MEGEPNKFDCCNLHQDPYGIKPEGAYLDFLATAYVKISQVIYGPALK